jgi:hypothetical protein
LQFVYLTEDGAFLHVVGKFLVKTCGAYALCFSVAETEKVGKNSKKCQALAGRKNAE